MAQPKQRGPRGGLDGPRDEGATAQQRKQLADAEVRLRAIYDKRDHYNALASEARSVRDTLNESRRGISEGIRTRKTRKDELMQERSEHIALRDRYQAKAKAMIAARKQVRAKIHPNLISEVEAKKVDLRKLERDQETLNLSIEKERALLKRIQAMKAEVRELERRLTEQSGINAELESTDGSIDDLFKRADIEHATVVQFSEQIGVLIEEMGAMVEDIKAVSAESDRKHEEMLEQRERADHYHQKAVELRSKVLGIRKELQLDRQEERDQLDAQRAKVAEELEDDEKLDAAAADALDALQRGEKLSF